MTATPQSVGLRSIAQRVADALPATAEEVVLTGSVSRGVADDVSDIEMLIVTRDDLDLGQCFELAHACGMTSLGTWGQQGVPTKRVSGYRDGVPVELIWWSLADAESAIDAIFAGELSGSADAIANGVGLRTAGLLAEWQERLGHYPDELASARIEDAALTWGGFAAAGLLTLVRPRERVALVERLVDDAARVVQIVFALNRVWPPTLKRLADRVAPLVHKPERLAERIEEALTVRDPLRAVLVMTELQAETVALAPDGPNVVRAREWLSDAREILTRQSPAGALAGESTVVRPATTADVDLLVAWHADPGVAEFWDDETFTPEEIRARLARVDVDAYVIEEDGGEPVGYLQAWSGDRPDECGLDMFLIPEARGRGLGPDSARTLAWSLLREGRPRVTVDPYVWNDRAVRAWQKAGFRAVQECEPDDEHAHAWLLMVFDPSDL